jgi:hypothetical protein
VELDRAAGELSALLAPGTSFTDGPASAILGATTRLGRGHAPDGRAIWIVLLEPDTEGRLAATLAHAGEGWATTWASAGPGTGTSRMSAARPGPLGVERLILGGPVAGPHHLLVEAATIGT